MNELIWQRTADAVRTAFDSGDLAGLRPLLDSEVRWHGASPGGCHSAAEVLAWIGDRTAEGVRFRLIELRRSGHRVLLHVVVEPGAQEVHQMLTLDSAGRIVRLLDYSNRAVAERDLAAPARDRAAGPVGHLVPFVRVRDAAASIAFYRQLGFAVTDEYRPHDRLVWAALRSGKAELMLAESGEPVDAALQGVLFYLYSDNLAELRQHLRANGISPSEIADGSPGPREELRVDDPDGYCLMIAQRAT
ncbi:MAG TPA: VOC family protein [Pseudonocardiaceae bacterium]|jgi:catechol 2,3-dioxygenase-like lactoylglutathione lyase family enzyme|nr:VOC family protein [Pseudonocardiaceae bacterium]